MRTIRIIGGGIAGLSLGIHLRKLGVKVEVIESGNYPKHKVCGEFISGISSTTVEQIGLEDTLAQAVELTRVKWWIKGDPVLEDRLPIVAWGLSRYKLDLDLADQFQKWGGELQTGRRVAQGDTQGIVWATGKRKKKGPWIGLKIHTLGTETDGLEMDSGNDGYIGLSRIEDNKTNWCGLFRINQALKGTGSDLIEAYMRANGLTELADRFKTCTKDSTSFSATAGFSFGNQPRRGSFCVGDASYLIPPFTGNGMSMALESAWIAGPILKSFSRGETSWQEACISYDSACAAFFRKRMKLSTTLQPLFLNSLGRTLLKTSAKSGILPFDFLFHQLRTP